MEDHRPDTHEHDLPNLWSADASTLRRVAQWAMKIRHLVALLFVGQYIYVVHVTDDPWVTSDEALLGLAVQLAIVYGIAWYLDREDREDQLRSQRLALDDAQVALDAARFESEARERARRERYAIYMEARRTSRAPIHSEYRGPMTFTTPEIPRGWTAGFKKHLIKNWHYVCPWCGEFMDEDEVWNEVNGRAITLDHITPRARGGTDAVGNLQPMHWACNRAKGVGSMARAPAAQRSVHDPGDQEATARPDGVPQASQPDETVVCEGQGHEERAIPWTMRRHVFKRQNERCDVCSEPLDFDDAVFNLPTADPFVATALPDVRATHRDCSLLGE